MCFKQYGWSQVDDFRKRRSNYQTKTNGRSNLEVIDFWSFYFDFCSRCPDSTDKSRNIYIYIYIYIYITQKGGYNKYVNEKVTKTYKLAATNRAKYINYKLKILEENVVADDRIEKMEEAEVYITVKDHK